MLLNDTIVEQVSEVIKYSQGIEEPKVKELLNTWSENKSKLVNKVLGGNIIYEHPNPITFELNEDSKKERIDHFIEYVGNLIGYSSDFVHYLEELEVDEFYENLLKKDFCRFDKKINKGTKIIKSFKYFVKGPLLEELQNKASELIQENKVNGTLCFSVHPLDFLSSSENNYNWRSCHALDGEYRCGNLSYMTDRVTFICYLKSNKGEVKLPNFPNTVLWNDKKWRCLLYIDEKGEVMFAGRQYPFFSPGALETIREILLNIWSSPFYGWPHWSHWHNDYIKDFEYKEYSNEDYCEFNQNTLAIINHSIVDIKEKIKDVKKSQHYNDLLYSSCYIPYYMFHKSWRLGSSFQLEVGNSVKCLRCGEEVVTTKDTMMCPECEISYGNGDCDDYATCDCCGRRFLADDGHWVDEDDYICDSCYESETFRCAECGERLYNSNKRYDKNTEEFICVRCAQERGLEEE